MIFCNLCGSFVAVQGERNQLHARDIVACARHEKDEENVLTDTEIIDLYDGMRPAVSTSTIIDLLSARCLIS